MQVVVKRTQELDSAFMEEYTGHFNAIFGTQFSVQEFLLKYRSPPTGFSLHSIVTDDAGRFGGMNTVIPIHYEYHGQRVLWGLHCDTFLLPSCRGSFRILSELFDSTAQAARALGITVLFGVPNNNSYRCLKQIAQWKDIGAYDYYVLPLRAGTVLHKGSWLNLLSLPCCQTVNLLTRLRHTLGGGTPVEVKPVRVVRDDAFWKYRLQQGDYQFTRLSQDTYFVYRIFREGDVPCGHLIDYFPRSRRILEQAVLHICRQHGREIDLVLFAGRLTKPATNLFRVPPRFRPRELRFCAKILAGDFGDLFEIDNWELGILLMDTR